MSPRRNNPENLLTEERRKRLAKRKRFRRPLRWLTPDKLEGRYARDLIAVLNAYFQGYESQLVNRLPGLINEFNLDKPSNADSLRSDGWAASLITILTPLRASLDPTDVEATAQAAAEQVNAFNVGQRNKVIRAALGADIFAAEPWLADEVESFVAENVALIKDIGDKTATDVEGIVKRGLREGKTNKEISAEIRQRFTVGKNRARLIARDQVGKLNGQLTKLRQEELGLTRYVWRTVGDERVRASHRANDGEVFSWDKPPATGHPGEDIQCRCYAEPDFSDLLED